MRPRAGALAIVSALAVSPIGAKEHIVEATWSPAGEFKAELSMAPGKFKEVCVPLKQGDRVEWSFSSRFPTDFNVHYHVGKETVYPVKTEGRASGQGTLEVAVSEVHCWMWKARAEPLVMSTSLKRLRSDLVR